MPTTSWLRRRLPAGLAARLERGEPTELGPFAPARDVAGLAPLRWGILGTGKAANQFATALAHLPDAALVAVGSRRQERASAFVRRHRPAGHGVRPAAVGSYRALVARTDVDIVYVATPHTRHHDDTLLALGAGCHVLCEKPFAVSVREAEEMVAAAREADRFLMEGMWSAFLPAQRALAAMVADGRLGPVAHAEISLGYDVPVDPRSRLYDPGLGGGVLLDLGPYPLHVLDLVGERLEPLSANGIVGETGVDEEVELTIADRVVIRLTCRQELVNEAHLGGERADVVIPRPLTRARSLVVDGRTVDHPFSGNGLAFEIAHVLDRIRAGQRDSDIVPLDRSIRVVRALEQAAAQVARPGAGRR